MKRLFILSVIGLAINGCSKKNDGAGIHDEKCKIVSIKKSMPEVYTIFNFRYDAQGKISTVAYIRYDSIQKMPLEIESTYSYHTSSIVANVSYKNKDELSHEDTYTLDKRNLIISDSQGRKFEYDSEGKLIKITSRWGSYSIFSYKDGNLVSQQDYDEDGKPNTLLTDSFEYDYTNEYIPYSMIYGVHYLDPRTETMLYEQGFFGKRSKNRIKSYNTTEISYTLEPSQIKKLSSVSPSGFLFMDYYWSCK
ncbi:MAG: DUF4595 domain-containing protein [Sphingobacterium sp.]|jgi:YD repeat-containing protein|uniref:DUF4595 domain-containing protein n=1 Tax=Sphingobacterium sp. TaxID=341027 RepID=UPI00284BEFA8|nr:DUF4595 domain-containing protein [Sphingobacterium sp.]MDR3006901.1 DUF4595 domain-containing protein [Sphingobacterium sp.]